VSGRLTHETKATITLAGVWTILVALAGFMLWFASTIRADAVWRTTVDMRVQRLEDEKCPCRDFFERVPQAVER